MSSILDLILRYVHNKSLNGKRPPCTRESTPLTASSADQRAVLEAKGVHSCNTCLSLLLEMFFSLASLLPLITVKCRYMILRSSIGNGKSASSNSVSNER